jgi:hypothetical protein
MERRETPGRAGASEVRRKEQGFAVRHAGIDTLSRRRRGLVSGRLPQFDGVARGGVDAGKAADGK